MRSGAVHEVRVLCRGITKYLSVDNVFRGLEMSCQRFTSVFSVDESPRREMYSSNATEKAKNRARQKKR